MTIVNPHLISFHDCRVVFLMLGMLAVFQWHDLHTKFHESRPLRSEITSGWHICSHNLHVFVSKHKYCGVYIKQCCKTLDMGFMNESQRYEISNRAYLLSKKRAQGQFIYYTYSGRTSRSLCLITCVSVSHIPNAILQSVLFHDVALHNSGLLVRFLRRKIHSSLRKTWSNISIHHLKDVIILCCQYLA
jgi:hypothetical protein